MRSSELAAKYDARVPRYTSYPTAAQFGPAVTAETYAGWLATLPDATVLSLYLHVPFCARLCWYCGCHTSAVRGRAPLVAYADALLAEIDIVVGRIGRRLPVAHVHWGGGTPHALPPEQLARIMRHLRAAFAVAADAEVAVEVDPRTADAGAIEGLAAIGITRASLGVQDLDPAVQRAVNRVQSFEATAACAARLRACGVRSINLDLMYGLPHQTEAGVARTASRALDVVPDRLCVFGYAHVPWMKRHQALIDARHLPGAEARWRQALAAEAAITARGYRPVGLDHYARPGDALAVAAEHGRMRRNFQGYTTDSASVLIGLGASSIGALPHGYAQNVAAVPEYYARVRAGRLASARGVATSAEDRLRRDIIEQLMCRFEVDLDATAARHGGDATVLRNAAPSLAALATDGVIRWDGRRVEVQSHGRPLVRVVASVFDAYYHPEAARHAPAV